MQNMTQSGLNICRKIWMMFNVSLDNLFKWSNDVVQSCWLVCGPSQSAVVCSGLYLVVSRCFFLNPNVCCLAAKKEHFFHLYCCGSGQKVLILFPGEQLLPPNLSELWLKEEQHKVIMFQLCASIAAFQLLMCAKLWLYSASQKNAVVLFTLQILKNH